VRGRSWSASVRIAQDELLERTPDARGDCVRSSVTAYARERARLRGGFAGGVELRDGRLRRVAGGAPCFPAPAGAPAGGVNSASLNGSTGPLPSGFTGRPIATPMRM
jgi:hypothetical protein